MEPIGFPEQNCVFAKDQPEYLPLPVHKTPEGEVISCWQLTGWERVKVFFRGRIWWSVLTFNKPLQPQCPFVDSPFISNATNQAEAERR
jgi:hypothetical protein